MDSVLLVIHLLACTALIGAVLLQRSEGGALGMGGGGTGGFISGRGAADVLVRTTMILGAAFFVTSLVLARLNSEQTREPTALEREIDERKNEVFDPLSPGAQSAPVPTSPGGSTPSTAGAASAPSADPLAPVVTPASPAQQAPAATTGASTGATSSAPAAPSTASPSTTAAPTPAPATSPTP